MERQRECAIGDLTSKCGPLNFENRRARLFCTDSQLGTISRSQLLSELNYGERLTVRIGDSDGSDLGCAPLGFARPRTATAQFSTSTTFGSFQFWQNGPDDRTMVRPHLTGLGRGGPFSLMIFEGIGPASDPCNRTLLGNVYTRPRGAFTLPVSTSGILTGDSCLLGNLNSILPLNDDASFLRSSGSSNFLPLFGPYSIIGRTLALLRADNTIVACSPIMCIDCTPGRFSSLLGYQDFNNIPL